MYINKFLSLENKNFKKFFFGSNLNYVKINSNKENITGISSSSEQKIISIDKNKKIIHVSSGLQIGNLLNYLNSIGYTIDILPGHPKITIGGCIANNVHGKINTNSNSFKDLIEEIEILDNKYKSKILSRKKFKNLFNLTCGGFGLTGYIKSAKIKVIKRNNIIVTQRRKFVNFNKFCKYFINSKSHFLYAWADIAELKNFKGIIFESNYNKEKYYLSNFFIKNFKSLIGFKRCLFNFKFIINIINMLFFHFSDLIIKNKQSPFKFHFPQYPLSLNGIIFSCSDFVAHQILLEEKNFKKYFIEMSSFSKNQIYYTVVKKMNAKKHNISFSGTGILLSVTFKKNNKELIKKLYNLDIKYKAIPNLYFNDLFANRYLKRYFGQSYNKFKLNTKNIIKKQKIFTKISNKL
tara:strand:- start:892 stop:2112 length:1221 start_codon:yes stop_codon:yes gene_type:complete